MSVWWRSRWACVALAVLAAAVFARLGWWQWDRARTKLALQASLQARDVLPPLSVEELARDAALARTQQHRRVRLRGEWVSAATVYLDNRPMVGKVGFEVLTPLKLADRDEAIVVWRGWLPRHMSERTRMAPFETPTGLVDIEARVMGSMGRVFEFKSEEVPGAIRQNLDLDAYALETGLRLWPVTVQQLADSSPVHDGLGRAWAPPAAKVDTHRGYAFQWFSLSALVVLLMFWFLFKRPRRAAT